jgi:hypothetical protein
MPELQLFEYAVVRVVPRVEREEFINVGVILYCPQQKFLQTMITLNEIRLCAFTSDPDSIVLNEHLWAFEKVCNGGAAAGPIGKLERAARFRWLTAARSTIVQTSKVHPGLCTDAAETLTRLHAQLVL